VFIRVVPTENIRAVKSLPHYDKEKYREMTLDTAAETILGSFGFDRTVYDNFKRNNERSKWRWYEELKEQRVRDMKLRCFDVGRKGAYCMCMSPYIDTNEEKVKYIISSSIISISS
jgi:hypothetical protein